MSSLTPRIDALTPTVLTSATLAANTTYTLPHGLGHVPTTLVPSLLVDSATDNWSAGDEIFRWVDGLTVVEDTQIYVGADATNVIIRVNSTGVAIFDKSTGAAVASAVTNFKLRVRVT